MDLCRTLFKTMESLPFCSQYIFSLSLYVCLFVHFHIPQIQIRLQNLKDIEIVILLWIYPAQNSFLSYMLIIILVVAKQQFVFKYISSTQHYYILYSLKWLQMSYKHTSTDLYTQTIIAN